MFSKLFKCCSKTVEDKKDIVDISSNIIVNNNVIGKDLIVDDSDPNRSVIKRYLLREGRQTDEAVNGEDAINVIKKNGVYNIIWMDIQMPRMNGIKCTEYLRNTLGYKGVIIGLTGHVDVDSVNDSKKAGMQDVMAKPIDKKMLEVYIEKYKNYK
jgi:CheY-like chemotaxis protein